MIAEQLHAKPETLQATASCEGMRQKFGKTPSEHVRSFFGGLQCVHKIKVTLLGSLHQ